MLPLSLPGGCAGVWRGSNSHFDRACFAAVAWAWCWGVFRLTCVVASCDVLPLLGWLVWRRAVLFIAWRVWWRAVSRLAFMVASHAVLTWRAGEGGGLILPALAKSAPTLPSPPRHHGTARCAACGGAGRNAAAISLLVASFARFFLFLRVPAFRCRRTRDRTGKG